MHEESRFDRLQRFSLMHSAVRVQHKKSQEFMAAELNVSKKTVQNWEKGISSPSFFQSLEWFRVLNVNPFPHYFTFVFPDRKPKGDSDEEKINAAFNTLAEGLPISTKRALLYLWYGEHGSSPGVVVQMLLAHLHTPMKDRVAQAYVIYHTYDIEKQLGNLVCPENILPNIEALEQAINSAKNSVLMNQSGYTDLDGRI